MTRPCKVGVQLPEVERFVPWPEYLDLARRAEEAGYDSIWVGDHLVYDLPDGSTRGPYEAWTTLAAIATVTARLEIGLPVRDSWNVWWSIYDNTVERFAEIKAEVDAVTPEGRGVEATAAVLVTLPGGQGRLMGEAYDARVTTVTPDDLGDHVRGLADA